MIRRRGLAAVAAVLTVVLLAACTNDSNDNGTKWISDMGGQAYPGLADPGARVAIDYGLYGVPESFVVDQKGKIAYKFIGPINPNRLVSLFDSLLAANPTQ